MREESTQWNGSVQEKDSKDSASIHGTKKNTRRIQMKRQKRKNRRTDKTEDKVAWQAEGRAPGRERAQKEKEVDIGKRKKIQTKELEKN